MHLLVIDGRGFVVAKLYGPHFAWSFHGWYSKMMLYRDPSTWHWDIAIWYVRYPGRALQMSHFIHDIMCIPWISHYLFILD